jgi:hypothetical protein
MEYYNMNTSALARVSLVLRLSLLLLFYYSQSIYFDILYNVLLLL